MLALGLSALGPRAVALEPASPDSAPAGGTIFVSDSEAISIVEFAPGANGNVSPAATITGSNTGLNRPHGLALDSAGDLFVANTGFNSIIEYAAGANGNAAPLTTISGSSTGLENPVGVALDSAGKLYVANSSNVSVTEYASGANGNVAPLATISLIPLGADELQGITVDPNGDVFVTANDTIYEFAPGANGNATPIAAVSGPDTGLGTPIGPVLNPAGDLFVANFSGTQSITQYSAGANGDAMPASTITGADTGLNSPDGLSLDSAGHVFVTNSNTPSVTEYAPGANGDAMPVATISGSSTGLSIPTGVVVATAAGAPRGTHIAALRWNPSPVAPPASLKPGATVNLTVTALDARARPIPSALVYVSLSRPPGSAATAKCGTKTLPAYCMAGARGTVAVAYHSSLHLIRPAFKGGTDVLTAAVDPFGTLRTDDGYTYPGPGPVTRVSWSPSPIAPAGSLAAGQTAHAVVTALDAAGSPVPKGTVYLKPSLVPGGSGTFPIPAHCVAITPTPGNKWDKCPAGPTGQISVSYSHGAAIPPGGSDAMRAAVSFLHATPVADLYSYSAAIDHLRWTPSPVAPAASLAPGATVQLKVTAEDAGNLPIPDALVYVSLSRVVGSSATAKCGTTALPAYCRADSGGVVAVTYHASQRPIRPLVLKGTDILIAAVDPFGTSQATDGYTYAGPGPVTRVSWEPSPVAAAGSLRAGHAVGLVVTALDAAGSPVARATIYLNPALVPGGSGKFTVHANCVTVTVTPGNHLLKCPTGATGQVSVTYVHGTTIPAGGSDGIGAAATPRAGLVWDVYTYL
jgi:sugar lactone lactonase YvrE